MTKAVVFLLDVDNTLLDCDYLVADYRHHIKEQLGETSADRYWAIFNEMRSELGYVDYLGALQRYRLELERQNDGGSVDPLQLSLIAGYMIDYPFAERLYDRAFAVIRHLSSFGMCVILTDGDVVLQPRKIQRAGLWDAVDGRVLIYVHKEEKLGSVEQLYPAQHYVLIDDKPAVLAAVKSSWRSRVTTILPLQGHYALDEMSRSNYCPSDIIINDISQAAGFDLPAMFGKIPENLQQTA